jgi:hypothetical protein
MSKKPSKGSVASKPHLTFWKAALSVDEISKALKVAPGDVISKFRDGRVTSWFAEIWGERVFKYTKHPNSNYPGSDGSIDLGAIGPFKVSVRSLTNSGIKFQKSANIGSGRSATQHDVYNAVAGVELVVVVDIRNFPDLTFIPIDSKWLMTKAHNGILTPRGLTAARLYNLLGAEFTVKEEPFDLAAALASCSPKSLEDLGL